MTNITKTIFNFNGKNITSDGWSFLITDFLNKICLKDNLNNTFGKNIDLSKRWPKVQYNTWELIYQSILGYMKWYANPTEISRTKNDPINTELLKINIPSQSTFSRLNNEFNEEFLDWLEKTNSKIVDSYFSHLINLNNWKKLESIEISDDSTKIETFWKQEWWKYIYHYWVCWYHPDLITEDNLKLILIWKLRDWNVYSSTGSELLINDSINKYWKYADKIIFRWDSAYSKPEIFKVLHRDDIKIEYFVKVKSYLSWVRNFWLEIEYNWVKYNPLDLPIQYFEEKNKEDKIELVNRYFTIYNICDTWDRKEKIIVQMKYMKAKEIEINGFKQEALLENDHKNIQFLITNSELEWEKAFEMYWKRWKQEQLIDELKNDSFCKNLSSSTKIQNACTFQIKIIAHNLIQILRLISLRNTEYENCRTSTLRRILFYIWWKIVKHAWKVIIKLSDCFIYKNFFKLALERIQLTNYRIC